MIPERDILAIARAAGAIVRAESHASSGEAVVTIDFPSDGAKLRMLSGLATRTAESYDVIRLARSVCVDAGARSEAARANAIHAWVSRRLAHCLEPVETFPEFGPILAIGLGDCDDAALVVMALCLAAGLEAGLQAFGRPHTHVCAAVKLGGQWYPLETTIAAWPGEDPYAAARRLGLDRRDLALAS